MYGTSKFFARLLLFAALAVQVVSCSSEESPENRERERAVWGKIFRLGGEDESSGRAVLVPIVHLTSPHEDYDPSVRIGREIYAPQDFAPDLKAGVSGEVRALRTPEAVVRHVSRTPSSVGFVPLEDLDARVKALGVGGREPLAFGGDYPFRFGGIAAPRSGEFERIVVGGDIVLDRGLPYAVYQLGYGTGFPMSGGYAAVTSRNPVASEFSEYGVIHEFTAERRGESGAVREFLSGADLTLANLENPVLANATYHPEGTVFEGDLSLLPILSEAGIDGVTLSNNHILDAGEAGLYETISHLGAAGIRHTGAGRDLAAAREPMIFDLEGTTVGVLNYQNVPGYEWSWATDDSFGTAPLTGEILREDIRALKEEVDTVIVLPHWGGEYTATPEAGQVDLAHIAIEAGADAVVGGHAHWAKGMEVYREAPVYYGLGNFLFDQVWSEETSTGIFAELILYEGRIVQSRPVPYIVLDYGQPNFLVPESGGRQATDGVFAASLGPEFGNGFP